MKKKYIKLYFFVRQK